MVDQFVSSMKSNILGFLSFYTSIILLGLIKGKDPRSLFDGDIDVFAYAVLFISFAFFVGVYTEFKTKIGRYENLYLSLKNRYKDILNESDLNKLFDEDSEHLENKKFMNDQMAKFACIWFVSIITFAFITMVVSG